MNATIKPLQVGKDYYESSGSKKKKVFANAQVLFDCDGWADVNRFLPRDFELVKVLLKNNKMKNGWFNISRWDGLKILPTDEVVAWRKINEENFTE
jgi:hypothetical protein